MWARGCIYRQEYLVRGTFLVRAEDEDEVDDEPAPNTYGFIG